MQKLNHSIYNVNLSGWPWYKYLLATMPITSPFVLANEVARIKKEVVKEKSNIPSKEKSNIPSPPKPPKQEQPEWLKPVLIAGGIVLGGLVLMKLLED